MKLVKLGDRTITAETATTPKQRQKGLMGRKELSETHGMLLDFNTSEKQSIWMKNTDIPLDIIFLKQDGTITDIKQGTPHSTEHVESSEPCTYVLEVNQGFCESHGIEPGDKAYF